MKSPNREFHSPDINRVKLMALLPVRTDLKLSVNMLITIIKPMIIILKTKSLILHIKTPYNPKNKTVRGAEYTPNYKIVTTSLPWKENTEKNSHQFNNL